MGQKVVTGSQGHQRISGTVGPDVRSRFYDLLKSPEQTL